MQTASLCLLPPQCHSLTHSSNSCLSILSMLQIILLAAAYIFSIHPPARQSVPRGSRAQVYLEEKSYHSPPREKRGMHLQGIIPFYLHWKHKRVQCKEMIFQQQVNTSVTHFVKSTELDILVHKFLLYS